MKKSISLLLAIALALLLTACTSSRLNPRKPVTLTMWHVYGEQAESPMNRLLDEFNRTVDMEKGIVINVTLMSNNTQVGPKLLDAQANKPRSVSMPDLFFGHVSNARMIGEESLLNWKDHFSEKELSGYVSAFVEDGMIGDQLIVFPVSKSTHLLFINGTQFERYGSDTGASYSDLAIWEGFFDVAEKYYNWSGGKCFCAFDAIDHFEFADSGYASLYAALKQTREKGILTQEPSFTGYYGKVTALYDSLREIQDDLEMRASAGEDITSLVEETWQLFSTIR